MNQEKEKNVRATARIHDHNTKKFSSLNHGFTIRVTNQHQVQTCCPLQWRTARFRSWTVEQPGCQLRCLNQLLALVTLYTSLIHRFIQRDNGHYASDEHHHQIPCSPGSSLAQFLGKI